MKGLIISGLLMASPFHVFFGGHAPHGQVTQYPSSVQQQQMQQTSASSDNTYATWQQKLMEDFQALQSLFHLTGGDQRAQNIDDQVNQVLQDMQQLNTMLDQNAVRHIGVRQLPRHTQQQGAATQTQRVANGPSVAAGDRGVSAQLLQSSAQIIQTISQPILKDTLSQTPSSQTEVTLFSSKTSYANALLQAGVPRSELNAIASNTGGLTIGNQVWIPLYNLKSQADLANVLTHELTHVVFNQQGIGDNLQTWINEGVAWHDGMIAYQKADPAAAKQYASALNRQISQAANSGALLPLNASEDQILRANYNVEWVDYLAVQSLITSNGENTFKSFLASLPKQGIAKSFQNTYGQSINAFEQNFINKL